MTVAEISVKPLEALLEASSATPEFKAALRDLAANKPQRLVRFNPGSPPVKVLRAAMKLIETHPEMPIESLEVHGQSGCSEFAGRAVAEPGARAFNFEWDCRWRAEERGWTDAFGDPDQIRAAQTFGYQCFRRFEEAR